jgi:hypothetical protein
MLFAGHDAIRMIPAGANRIQKEFCMPKKMTPAQAAAPKSIAKPVEKTVSTPVRNTPIPKVAAAAPFVAAVATPRQVTREQIAKRAFEIFASGTGGSESDNWFRAERELRGL